MGEKIRDEFGDGAAFGFRLEYSFDGPRLLGTGGAIKRALPRLGEAFVILYGDSYLPMDYAAAIDAFVRSGKPGLMTVFHNEGRWDTSNVVFADGTIRRYDKKALSPEMQHIDYGLGILRADALAAYPDDQPFDLADVYGDLSRAGQPWPATKCATAFTRSARIRVWLNLDALLREQSPAEIFPPS